MEDSRVPNRLKMFRRCCGHSQKKVARVLGLSDTSALSRWERGVTLPSIVQAFRLARVYRTLPHELFDEVWKCADSTENLLSHDSEPFKTNQSFFV